MKTSRTPKSREQLQRVILRMADSAQGLTWRRLHDAVATDDRVRARETLYDLAMRGHLHMRIHGRVTMYFATAAQASAWKAPPAFNQPRPAAHARGRAAPAQDSTRAMHHRPQLDARPALPGWAWRNRAGAVQRLGRWPLPGRLTWPAATPHARAGRNENSTCCASCTHASTPAT
ncbi:MAG: hypothetical protein MUF16_22765 [Burkholderiaceae bacterium]|nr:hypothetical protein [Burkholderiaceae bacterium]